jgi:deoxyribonuclease IV
MLLGAHVSISGGVDKAPENGHTLGCQAIQVFTRNQMQWKAPPLSSEVIACFRKNLSDRRIEAVVCHDSYLINLGSPEALVLQKSRAAFAEEIERCEQLGIPYLVFHPGAHVGSGETEGIRRIAESLNEVFNDKRGTTQVLLETTAGQGSNLGYRFEQLAEILSRVRERRRVGVCVDTCHIFAAGYDLRTRSAYEKTFKELDDVVGLKHVKAFHLNDSKKGLGSRVDRHESIGKGELGLRSFRFLVNDPRFAGLPMLLETPWSEEAYRGDLSTLRNLKS